MVTRSVVDGANTLCGTCAVDDILVLPYVLSLVAAGGQLLMYVFTVL